MKNMIQTSCSELLVDTAIHDPEEALTIFSTIFREYGLESSPPLSLEVLEQLKISDKKITNISLEESQEVMVYDKYGNRCWLEYGDNGYLDYLGYRFDSHCSDYDTRCYPIFNTIIEKVRGHLYACDGGHKDGYYDWEKAQGKRQKK